jgi:peptide/nickel transport system substrate-binding protein
MLGKKYFRLAGLSLSLVMVLSLVFGITKAQDGKTIIIGWEQEPGAPALISSATFSALLDNFNARDVWAWEGAERKIYPVMVEEVPTPENGLVTTTDVMWDDDQNPDTPDVAGKAPVVTYKLHAGMKWSDGEPVTADDCMFYHKLMMQPDPVDSFGRGFYPDVVAGAEKVDDLTVKLTYKVPWPDYQVDALLSCAVPAHINEKFMDSDGDGVFDANFDQSPYGLSFQDVSGAVGYGPFMLAEFNAGSNAKFVKNPNWGANAWEKVPAFDTLITQFITQSEQMENAMEVGDIDVAFNFDGVNNSYGDMANVNKFVTDTVYGDALWFNTGSKAHPAMQDIRVRDALVAAIDRRTIANQFAGEGSDKLLLTSWFFPQWTSPNVKFREYDVDKARQLLTEAGWVDADGDEGPDNDSPTARVSKGVTLPDGTAVADGEQLILRFYTTPRVPRPDVQTVVAADLQKVGVATQIFVVNGANVLFGSWASRSILYRGDYDMAIYALSAGPLSPNGSPPNFHCSGIPSEANPSGQNNTWFCNEEYDKLDNQVATELDPAKRLELSYKATELFDSGNFWNMLFPRPEWYAVRTDVLDPASMQDMGTLASNYFNHIEDWTLAS